MSFKDGTQNKKRREIRKLLGIFAFERRLCVVKDVRYVLAYNVTEL